MSAFLFRMCFVGFLLLSVKSGVAQKSIMISDSLAANTENLPVKTGNAWPWKVSKFSFGDYTVASSRSGWGTSTSKSNLLGTRTQSKSTQRFSFVLTSKTSDSATVDAANDIVTRELQSLELFPNVFLGRMNC